MIGKRLLRIEQVKQRASQVKHVEFRISALMAFQGEAVLLAFGFWLVGRSLLEQTWRYELLVRLGIGPILYVGASTMLPELSTRRARLLHVDFVSAWERAASRVMRRGMMGSFGSAVIRVHVGLMMFILRLHSILHVSLLTSFMPGLCVRVV